MAHRNQSQSTYYRGQTNGTVYNQNNHSFIPSRYVDSEGSEYMKHGGEQKKEGFKFSILDEEIGQLVSCLIDGTLQERQTILLAKYAREEISNSQKCDQSAELQIKNPGSILTNSSFIANESQKQSQNFLSSNKVSNFSSISNSGQSDEKMSMVSPLDSPLIHKTFEEINKHFSTLLSEKLIQNMVGFLRQNGFSAKLIVVCTFISKHENSAFHLGGACFWDKNSDGQKTIKRSIPGIGKQSCESGMLSQANSVCFPDSFLIVNIYFCKFQKSFHSK